MPGIPIRAYFAQIGLNVANVQNISHLGWENFAHLRMFEQIHTKYAQVSTLLYRSYRQGLGYFFQDQFAQNVLGLATN